MTIQQVTFCSSSLSDSQSVKLCSNNSDGIRCQLLTHPRRTSILQQLPLIPPHVQSTFGTSLRKYAAASQASALTSRLASCSSTSDLEALLSSHAAAVTPMDAPALLMCAVGLLQPPETSLYLPDSSVQLLNRVSELVAGTLPQLDTSAACTLLQALGTARHAPANGLLQLLLQKLTAAAGSGGLTAVAPELLAGALWGLARLEHYEEELVGQLVGALQSKVLALSPRGIGQLVFGLSQLRHYDAPLLQQLSSSLKELSQRGALGELTDRQLTDAALGFGALAWEDEALYQGLCKQLVGREVGQVGTQELCSMSLALALANVWSPELTAALVSELPKRMAGGSGGGQARPSLEQLRWVFRYLIQGELTGQMLESGDAAAYDTLRERAVHAWDMMLEGQESSLQKNVRKALRRVMGPETRMAGQQTTPDGLFLMDMAFIDAAGTRWALQVDGPANFVANDPRRQVGMALLRNRMLQVSGYRVAVVPAVGWPSGEAAQEEVLRELLSQQGVGLPPKGDDGSRI
eukprot:CAMPEP_0202898214 /NCGR_PEP_ID=MMETSP1392-20130828/6786_1 /ASSEMBLY_ACC=CAM_ASM_000868 /TAXON_ID=225041 /ORGANISM="Chlamydomonas chlamydogama, Strain SAG 11-48b" /LENGTH=520 /DNA_ID=CAMNT_0049584079 /DNA_START=60 /DNA_END=1622 /DNA_ORIENTATION=+